jgi:hypothetical protein
MSAQLTMDHHSKVFQASPGAPHVTPPTPPEASFYRLVRERLAKTTVFSIGDRATLRPFHARLLVVQLSGSGPASILEVPTAPDPAHS